MNSLEVEGLVRNSVDQSALKRFKIRATKVVVQHQVAVGADIAESQEHSEVVKEYELHEVRFDNKIGWCFFPIDYTIIEIDPGKGIANPLVYGDTVEEVKAEFFNIHNKLLGSNPELVGYENG
jgi:hypothetical protein